MQLARLEVLNLSLAIDNDGKGGGLHATKRRNRAAAAAAEPQCKGPRRIDTNEPVRLVAAAGGAGQWLHFIIAPQPRECFADRVCGHRL